MTGATTAAQTRDFCLLELGPDRMVELGHARICKDGERAAGDTVRLRRIPAEDRAVVVLSDGLGSGVKAGVLSSLTATMAMEYVSSALDPERVAGIITRTLPECRTRKIRYATFTAMNVRASGICDVVNYDNPGPFLVDERGCETVSLPSREIAGAATRRRHAQAGHLELSLGQYLVTVSDGVTQAGMGTRRHPFGWGVEGLRGFLHETVRREAGISGQELAERVVARAKSIDAGRPKDDISCAVVYLRRPRRLILVTGPPIDPDRDREIAETLDNFPGQRIIAGGTTANLIARELGREVDVCLGERDPEIPPASSMEGTDLVTEGTITMSRVLELLEGEADLQSLGRNGATRMLEALLAGDEIHMLVGTKINEAHQNPAVPVELEIRRNVMKRIRRALEERYLKQTYLRFV